MKLKLIRKYKKVGYTIGKLYIDGEYFCDTLEDQDRDLDDSMSEGIIKSKKIYGQTAIPTGTYFIDMNTVSPRFKNRNWAKPYNGKIPRLIAVKGFDGVLIHVGNIAADTLGCILVGQNKAVGQVVNSTIVFNKLMQKLKGQGNITITIV